MYHSVVIREKSPSKRCRIRSRCISRITKPTSLGSLFSLRQLFCVAGNVYNDAK